MYDELLFRRGYLLLERASGTAPPEQLADWGTERLDQFVLHVHPDLRCTVAGDDEATVALLGRAFNPFDGVVDENLILSTLLDRLSKSDEEFLDYLDRLSGRFVLVVEETDRTFALQDATGNRSLFYDDTVGDCRVASHAGILAELGDYERTGGAALIREVEAPWFPGVATPYAEVKRLTPNTLLSLPGTEVSRFFPREPSPSNPLAESLVSEVADVFADSMRMLNREAELSLSLSSGLDSRVSLAATKSVADDVGYRTWVTGEADKEVEAVRALCDTLGVDYEVVDLSTDPNEAFLDVFERTTAGMSRWNRARNAYNLYRHDGTERDTDDALAVRSNVAEIGRTFYRDRFSLLPNRVDAETLAKLYAYESDSEYVQREYAEFIDRTDFPTAGAYGYDVYDLFYWECRIGCWLSLWFQETAVAQDELSLFNNRELLRLLLSVDYEHRREDELFYRVVEQLWPECLDVPVNPHKEPTFRGADQMDRFLSGAVFRAPTPAYKTIRRLRRAV